MDAGPVATARARSPFPSPGAVLALLKPITWFPPMWAYLCGVVASGAALGERAVPILLGVLLAGPLICGTSQAVNDWFDREVDAINEPHRVIPSGRMPGTWGLRVAVLATLASAALAAALGPWVFAAALVGLALAWAYSAPPLRLKRNGWWGNGAVGFAYETIPWWTAAAAALGTLPPTDLPVVAVLYGTGAHGIMTLNDFKAMEGDRRLGIASLPVQLGEDRAARLACAIMAAAQVGVVLVLWRIGATGHALGVLGLTLAQAACMIRFLAKPAERAIWYSAIGVGLYVSGMMVAALALRGAA